MQRKSRFAVGLAAVMAFGALAAGPAFAQGRGHEDHGRNQQTQSRGHDEHDRGRD